MVSTTDLKKSQQPVQPVMVSQLTSLSTLGIPGKRFPSVVRSEGIPHRRIGQLTVAMVDDCVRVLAPAAENDAAPIVAVDPAERVRTALGLTKRGGR